jgi:hypothetical protein
MTPSTQPLVCFPFVDRFEVLLVFVCFLTYSFLVYAIDYVPVGDDDDDDEDADDDEEEEEEEVDDDDDDDDEDAAGVSWFTGIFFWLDVVYWTSRSLINVLLALFLLFRMTMRTKMMVMRTHRYQRSKRHN